MTYSLSQHLFQINIDIDNDLLNTHFMWTQIRPTFWKKPINEGGTQFQSASSINWAVLNLPAESINTICINVVLVMIFHNSCSGMPQSTNISKYSFRRTSHFISRTIPIIMNLFMLSKYWRWQNIQSLFKPKFKPKFIVCTLVQQRIRLAEEGSISNCMISWSHKIQCLRSVTTLSTVMATTVHTDIYALHTMQRFGFRKVIYCFEGVSGFPIRQINQTIFIWWICHSFAKFSFWFNCSKWYLIKLQIECDFFASMASTKFDKKWKVHYEVQIEFDIFPVILITLM